jgi:hypothetical protein
MTDADSPDDATLRRWLLQQLPDADAQALDERLLRDDAFAARLADAETDLIDDAARGRLDAADAVAFERHRLVDARTRERLQAARAFARLRDETPATVPRWRRHTLGIAAAAMLAAVAILLPVRRTAPPSEAALPTVALLADVSRSGGAVVHVAAATTAIRLQVEVNDATRRYALAFDTDGRRVPLAQDLVPRETGGLVYVETRVDAALLRPGRQRLLLLAAPGEIERDWQLDVGSDAASVR